MITAWAVEERAGRRSDIAQDRGWRAPGGLVGGVDPGQQRRPDREGDALIDVEVHAKAETAP